MCYAAYTFYINFHFQQNSQKSDKKLHPITLSSNPLPCKLTRNLRDDDADDSPYSPLHHKHRHSPHLSSVTQNFAN